MIVSHYEPLKASKNHQRKRNEIEQCMNIWETQVTITLNLHICPNDSLNSEILQQKEKVEYLGDIWTKGLLK